jgi:hypothetical protein
LLRSARLARHRTANPVVQRAIRSLAPARTPKIRAKAIRSPASAQLPQHSPRRQIPIAPAALSVPHTPRFPALALFSRRLAERVDSLAIAGGRKPAHKRTHPPFETGASTKNSETVVSHLSGDWNFSEISIADQCPREMVVPKGRVEISLFQRPALYHAFSTVHLVPNIFWSSSHRAAPPAEIKRVFEQRIPSDSVNAAAHQPGSNR